MPSGEGGNHPISMSDLHGISSGEPEDRAGEMQFARSSAVRHSPQISSRRADFLPVVFLKGHGDGNGGLLLTHLLDGAGAGILGDPGKAAHQRDGPRQFGPTAGGKPVGLQRWHCAQHVLQCHHCLRQAPRLVDFAPASPQAFLKSPFTGGASLK